MSLDSVGGSSIEKLGSENGWSAVLGMSVTHMRRLGESLLAMW